jgi:hypothetical protein
VVEVEKQLPLEIMVAQVVEVVVGLQGQQPQAALEILHQ